MEIPKDVGDGFNWRLQGRGGNYSLETLPRHRHYAEDVLGERGISMHVIQEMKGHVTCKAGILSPLHKIMAGFQRRHTLAV